MAAKPNGLASTDISISFSESKQAVTGALTSASFNWLIMTAWSRGLRFEGSQRRLKYKIETFVPHKTHVCAEGGDVPGFRCHFKLVVALIEV